MVPSAQGTSQSLPCSNTHPRQPGKAAFDGFPGEMGAAGTQARAAACRSLCFAASLHLPCFVLQKLLWKWDWDQNQDGRGSSCAPHVSQAQGWAGGGCCWRGMLEFGDSRDGARAGDPELHLCCPPLLTPSPHPAPPDVHGAFAGGQHQQYL